MLTKAEASRAMLAKLKLSALGNGDLKTAGYKAYTGDQVAEELPGLTLHPAAGFTLPYHTMRGKPTPFYRFRYLEQPPRSGFAALTSTKPVRYVQPPHTSPRVYFSKLLDWPKFFSMKREGKWMVITEGELKADCACKHGFPTLALGGVWNFMSKREGVPLLEDLKALPLKGVIVNIVYDSDATSNPSILKAENVLARQLLYTLEAQVRVVRLPKLKDQEKTGVDDFIVARGAEAFQELIDDKYEVWGPSEALHQLNEEVLLSLIHI